MLSTLRFIIFDIKILLHKSQNLTLFSKRDKPEMYWTPRFLKAEGWFLAIFSILALIGFIIYKGMICLRRYRNSFCERIENECTRDIVSNKFKNDVGNEVLKSHL